MLFQVSGLLYIGWQILLVLVSLSKICTGADGGWVVTTRFSQLSQQSKPARVRIGPDSPGSGPGSPPANCSPIGAAFASVPDSDDKVPNSHGRTSPELQRPPARPPPRWNGATPTKLFMA